MANDIILLGSIASIQNGEYGDKVTTKDLSIYLTLVRKYESVHIGRGYYVWDKYATLNWGRQRTVLVRGRNRAYLPNLTLTFFILSYV